MYVLYMRRTNREKGIKPVSVLCDCQSLLCCFLGIHTQINWFIQIICYPTSPKLENATFSFMACEACAFLDDLLDTYVVIFDDVVQPLHDKLSHLTLS